MKLKTENSEKTILVHLDLAATHTQEELQEFRELAYSAGADVVHVMTVSRSHPDVKFFIGSGKVEEIAQLVESTGAELVLFNHELTPAQERNLEDAWKGKVRVLDRTALILDIFAQRARTFEGKLQVELAKLEHLSTRLVRGWTHLERQKGGIGLRGGPGEKQIEIDRRLLRHKITLIKKQLKKVRSQREQNRRARLRKPVITISLVGYTNAGKSTLFNALTNADVYVADQLFATLDPTLRRLEWPEIGTVVFADTVGFIRHLPHQLIDAFRATLEETQDADLLLHVIDMAHPQRDENIAQVEHVLHEIKADHVPQIRVYNKIDLIPELAPRIDYGELHIPRAVYVSAQARLGIEQLQQAILEYLTRDFITVQLTLTPEQAKLRAQLYRLKAVLEESVDEQGACEIQARLSRTDYAKLFGAAGDNK